MCFTAAAAQVTTFKLPRKAPFSEVRRRVAEELRVPPEQQRFWRWAARQNSTYRPAAPLVLESEDQAISVGVCLGRQEGGAAGCGPVSCASAGLTCVSMGGGWHAGRGLVDSLFSQQRRFPSVWPLCIFHIASHPRSLPQCPDCRCRRSASQWPAATRAPGS
jgi:hypothetical protein